MSKEQIRHLIDQQLPGAGIVETGVKGVQLFRVSEPVPCVPAVYEPAVVAIVSGAKEAILDGKRHVYDSDLYLCCSTSMPVQAGTPTASPDNPLLGVLISLDARVMTELTLEMESVAGPTRQPDSNAMPSGLALAPWDAGFTDALLRLVQLGADKTDEAVLGAGRLRELYYAVLKGGAGASARRSFGVGNEIARTIQFLSAHLNEPLTIDDMAALAGMSRAVFHRKFKQATTMSPIQFAKSMRLNHAAMKIAGGMNVSEAAWDAGYVSSSQFSREFKRMYGQSPKQWSQETQLPAGAT
ncbi:AraC family transcriptional regulator [uncultured Roseibium sp.]|uniref:AraC family transcriptional regulator n=1 Tax=uncultured Roseibium sp. TaxID=1936171 RepID=UPI002632ECC1|nr:AraC family transcriptional regulator [uncultured Roseibium sp.]